MNEQLPLSLQLRASARFSSFVPGADGELLRQLQRIAAGTASGPLYCRGPGGSGKTHLLQACCHASDSAGRPAAYLSLREPGRLAPAVLAGWESFSLVCLDDIDAIAGASQWEEALFHLYNRLLECGQQLVVSAVAAPARAGFELPDLVSRLSAGLVYQLHPLDDDASLEALRRRARQRGFELPDDTGRYLLRRLPRDLPALMDLLERLDRASLAAQRRLTVPFVKSVLGLSSTS
jgi:DnaA family protein